MKYEPTMPMTAACCWACADIGTRAGWSDPLGPGAPYISGRADQVPMSETVVPAAQARVGMGCTSPNFILSRSLLSMRLLI